MTITMNIFATRGALAVAHDLCRDAVLFRAPGGKDYYADVLHAHIESVDASNATITITTNAFVTVAGALDWMNVDQTLIRPAPGEDHVYFDGDSYLSDKLAVA